MIDDNDYNHGFGHGYEDGKNQAKSDKASSALMMVIFSFFFKTILFLVLFCPGIFCAFFILNILKYSPMNQEHWKYFVALVTLVYVIECLVFFLKGWLVSLKERGNGIWMLLWIFCVLYCFAIPVLLLHTFIFMTFKPAPGHPADTLNIISWVGGVLISVFIYSRYALLSDSAPRFVSWAYRIGRNLIG